jgi:hypothetical protein
LGGLLYNIFKEKVIYSPRVIARDEATPGYAGQTCWLFVLWYRS